MDISSVKIVFQVLIVCGTLMTSSLSRGILCSCYTFQNNTKTWLESELYCTNKGGHLLSMETEEEWELINLAILNRTLVNKSQEWYIGLFNNTVNWRWISHHNLTYNKWRGNESRLGGKNCAVLAKNISSNQACFFKNVSCDIPKSFICEYNPGHGDTHVYGCDLSKPKYCWNYTEKTVIITRRLKQAPVLIFVVIGLGILLAGGIGFYIYIFYCKKSTTENTRTRSEWKFKYRASKSAEVTEPVTETSVQEGISPNDQEGSGEPQKPAQVAMGHSAERDYILPVPSTGSTCAALYSSVKVEENDSEDNEDEPAPKMASPYYDGAGEPVVYATVDKSKKTKAGTRQVEIMYAKVDKSRKNEKSNS